VASELEKKNMIVLWLATLKTATALTSHPMDTSQGVQLLAVAIVSSLKGSQLGVLQAPSTRTAAIRLGGRQAEERYRAKVAKYE
jgi:hypothetical protein